MARTRDALLGSSVSFAHLIGTGARAARRAKRAEDRDDDQEDDDAPGADDDDDGTDAKSAKGKRAKEGDETSDDDADDDGSDDEPKSRKTARGKRADDDGDDADDDDADDEEDPKARAARKRERARCAAIFGSKSAGKRPDLAAHLAFNTSLPRREAVSLLKAAAAGEEPKKTGLSARMESFGDFRVSGSAPSPNRRQAVTSSWDAAAASAGIKTRR
ncbi:hypothetical protein AA101099_1780 [Neoasaia chiangmaiensis NBRC 101099]|uniref:Uncharacterized protein n=1 Tax=Neoasaia chiangmaiensis TaxID=320497 RepID=A0A1U9KQY3_9PROT|nr:hypothetical protein [Neoasaia chiangmaiensis]AQS88264.1 hypothetical protein A0U93_10290 [Neoasaia chiangmaiensis]GBR39700.1 hypothetical protein AA101099_1780 [Neoasaia chiangmaiensis NBRC 101099]GEN14702.1 hypothetical protein NCH01_11330 [Neoasaia chiangmaiensis]